MSGISNKLKNATFVVKSTLLNTDASDITVT